MKDYLNRTLFGLAFCLVFMGVYEFYKPSEPKVPELSYALSKVQCNPKPKDEKHAKNNRMLIPAGDYSVMALCIPYNMMKHKNKLKCSYTDEDERVCDQRAVFKAEYVRSGYSDIFSGQRTTRTPDVSSSATIEVSQTPFYGHDKQLADRDEKYYTKEHEVTKGVDVPNKFTIERMFICEDTVSSSNTAECEGFLRAGNTRIKLVISMYGEVKETFNSAQHAEEIRFWLDFTDALIVPSEPS